MSRDQFETVERLIAVAAGSETDIDAAAQEFGFEATCNCLFAELADRSVPTSLPSEIVLHINAGWRGRTGDVGFVFGPDGMVVTAGVPADARARITISVPDLVRLLFAPERMRESARWVHRLLPWPPEVTTDHGALRPPPDEDLIPLVGRATQAVLGARQSPSLEELAVRCGSDKWGGVHWYTPHYTRHFQQFEYEAVKVLEIGIGGFDRTDYTGGSLHMWQRYFTRGLVFGVDIAVKNVAGNRIRTFRADQDDAEQLARIATDHGPFDIIIDDGSHVNEHVLTSFSTLFPFLSHGGLYVIEDLQTSYWTYFGGVAPEDDDGSTSVGMLKNLIDGLHHQEHRRTVSTLGQQIVELHLYHNIAFIKKGVNDECGPEWLRRFGFDPK